MASRPSPKTPNAKARTRTTQTNAKARIVIKHRGVLGAFGYHDVKGLSVRKRRSALRAAAMQLGWLYLIRKLNALYVFNKNRHPATARMFEEDRQYASAQHARTKRRNPPGKPSA